MARLTKPWVGIGQWTRRAWQSRGTHLTPPQVFVLSFLGLVAFGTIGFRVLPGLYTGPKLSWVDAVFTATSAVCLTGLTVVDTQTYFTMGGQAFLLLLVQIGGIGFITFTSLLILLIGQRLSVRQEVIWRSSSAPSVDYRLLVRGTVLLTLTFEALGALFLFALWYPQLGSAALWPAVFHAVSAFCNAGFSTWTDSLVRHSHSTGVLTVVMVLIVVGGLGFAVLQDLGRRLRGVLRRERRRLLLTSKLVLWVSLLLIVGGAAAFLWFEGRGVLSKLAAGDQVANAFFMSVTARTAGFNTIDYAQVGDRTAFFTILLMAIGGSPGSMAGGIKTTTVAVIGLLAWSRLRGDRTVSIFDRSISEENVQRSVGLFVLAFGITTAGLLALTSTELFLAPERRFLRIMFETVSAFNTVGLSMGITAELTTPGKSIASVLMFIGRVGPLAFSAALAARTERGTFVRVAREDVSIG